MITGYTFFCSRCKENNQQSIQWFTQLGFKKDGTIIMDGLCFVCGQVERRGITADKVVEAMLESDDEEDE